MTYPIIQTALTLVVIFGTFNSKAQITGSTEAIEVTEQLIQAMGGRDAWQQAKGIHVTLEGDYILEKVPWIEKYWLDFATPRGRYEITSPTTHRIIGWTTQGGWELTGDSLSHQEQSNHQVEIDYYRREPTVIIQRLAKKDPRLKVEIDQSNPLMQQLIIYENQESPLCILGLNQRHEPIYWTADFNNKTYQRILGPLKTYASGIRLYEWGTSKTGAWRYTHMQVELLFKSPDVDFQIPSLNR